MSKPHKCPVCDGTGQVYGGPGVGTSIYTATCNGCGGTGIVWEPAWLNPSLGGVEPAKDA